MRVGVSGFVWMSAVLVLAKVKSSWFGSTYEASVSAPHLVGLGRGEPSWAESPQQGELRERPCSRPGTGTAVALGS